MTAIDETIKQLEAARDRAIDLIAGLREFQSGLGSVPALAAPTATPPTAPKLVNITRSQPKRRYLNVRAKKTETPAAPVKESAAKSPRKPSLEKTPAAPTPPLRSFKNLDKPETLGQAMKQLIRSTPKFTGKELREKLLADAHTKALHDAASAGLFQANLTYWAKQGHLVTSGDESPLKSSYTIGNKEFFGL